MCNIKGGKQIALRSQTNELHYIKADFCCKQEIF